ncbi:MAG: AsmA family protein [Methyloceanibacter sp.]
MRLALWSLAAIIAVGVAVVFVAPLFISAEDVRNRLFAEIEEATGYRLTVNGSLHISAFPTLKLVAEDVGVAQTKGAGAVDLATAKELRFGLAVAPLLSGKVQLTEVALISPILTMPEVSPKTAGAEPSERAGGGVSIATALRSLSLDSLRIEDGTLVLRGEGGAPGKRIDGLNLEASLPAFDAPLSVDVKARFDGQPLGVTGSISGFGPFLDGEVAQLLLDVDAPAYFPQKLALMGSATYTGDVLALDGLSARAGETMLRGVVSADLSGAVPQIKASLNGDSLNVDGLLGGSAKAAAGPADSASGWSDAKIDFSGLKAVNAQINLSVERLSYSTIKAGPIGIRAAVAGGKLKLELPNFQLYGGVGAGVLSVDATGKVPVQTFRFSLSNLDAYPFLDDVAAFQRIEGKAAIAIDLAASGASQRAMVSALAGTASFEFSDGAIRGINVAKMVRNLGSATLSGWQSGDAEKTDFASLGASFKIAQGKAQTSDLHLSGPLVRMAGAGTVDLPAQTINLRVDPQVVASLEGQGGKNDLQGLGVPVAINGPWAAPSIYPDIAGILENPQAAYEKLSKLGGGLVKLPSADSLGGAFSSTGGIAGLVKGKAGGSIEDLIKADQGSGQGVVQGLGQLLGAEQAAAPAAAPAEPAAPQVKEPAKKKGKQKQTKAAGTAAKTAAKPVGSPPAQPTAVAPAKPTPKERIQHTFGAF